MVQSWKPDEIFPSLTSEDMSSSTEDILALFQGEKKAASSTSGETAQPDARKSRKNRPLVHEWNLGTLENVPESDFGSAEKIPGIAGKPVKLAMDEKQRLIYEAQQCAEKTILEARKTAGEIVTAARDESEKIRQDAYNNGRGQALAELDKAAQNAHLVINELQVWQKETIQQNEPLIYEVIHKIGRALFGEGLILDNEVLQQNLNRVMKIAESCGDLRVYLNQQDVFNLDPEWRRFQESLSGKKIQIIPSETILPGGCFVQGELGVVDARVETQLNSIMSALNPNQSGAKDAVS